MKAYGGVHVLIHIFLTSALVGGEMLASRPGRFTPRRNIPPYPFDRRLGGPQSQSGRLGEENILDPTRTQTPTPWSSSPLPFAIPITLPRLLERGGTDGKCEERKKKISWNS
jgi:hypothetical protein